MPVLGRYYEGGNGNPLQYCLENPVDRATWWAAIHGVAKSQTWLKWLGMPIEQHISVQYSRSAVYYSLQPHGLQHTRLRCPSPTPEFTQTPAYWVGHAILPSHLLSCSSPAFNHSQHQGFFSQWVSSLQQVSIGVSTSLGVLLMNTKDWFPLGLTCLISLLSRDLRVLSKTTVQSHLFFCAQLSLYSNSHIHTWPLEKQQPWLGGPLSAK